MSKPNPAMTTADTARTAALAAANKLAEVQNAIAFARQNPGEVTRDEMQYLCAKSQMLRDEIELRMSQYDRAIARSERKNG